MTQDEEDEIDKRSRRISGETSRRQPVGIEMLLEVSKVLNKEGLRRALEQEKHEQQQKKKGSR